MQSVTWKCIDSFLIRTTSSFSKAFLRFYSQRCMHIAHSYISIFIAWIQFWTIVKWSECLLWSTERVLIQSNAMTLLIPSESLSFSETISIQMIAHWMNKQKANHVRCSSINMLRADFFLSFLIWYHIIREVWWKPNDRRFLLHQNKEFHTIQCDTLLN